MFDSGDLISDSGWKKEEFVVAIKLTLAMIDFYIWMCVVMKLIDLF
jgi:hypothetical protein